MASSWLSRGQSANIIAHQKVAYNDKNSVTSTIDTALECLYGRYTRMHMFIIMCCFCI